ncbi:hypothetical protein BDP55DRAFT_714949 [Colletotrichum godetiae]|uniref:Altered inheritance of mitochondria protein 6 n=1 Tax=Colletotrichum godetiae TaxID=1209918 RepID=A0AAJ0ETI5_9PEZI|nr:uncharacterized protein BDP55DRAFT_714949 [Colletotrichum godetiae]KAK1676236.1 hypothetical protein BDP55DRAFT_714949 [Colletotrichum godetiae]
MDRLKVSVPSEQLTGNSAGDLTPGSNNSTMEPDIDSSRSSQTEPTKSAKAYRFSSILHNSIKSVQRLRLRKPSLLRGLLLLGATSTIASSVLITLLYVFIFVLQPQALKDAASQSFISNNPILTDGQPVDGLSRWLEDFSRSVIPIMCHSHNDYWRPYPLYSALAAGCTGVEADIWLSDDGSDLLIGHDEHELSPTNTLRSMYLDPLLNILNTMNPPEQWSNFSRVDRPQGIFRSQPNITVVLLLDIKSDPYKTWPVVMEQLGPLREKLFLTRFEVVNTEPGFRLRQDMWPGPVTIVGTGNLMDDRMINQWPTNELYQQYHDAFLDAPLEQLPDDNWRKYEDYGYFASQSWHEQDTFYASVSFEKSIGSVRTGFSSKQLAKLRRQISTAKWSGLKSRYWDLPSWPISHRDYVWEVLTREGVDMLNVDDLQSAARRGWTKGYVQSVIWIALTSTVIFLTGLAMTWCGFTAIKRHMKGLQSQSIVLA